MFLKHLEISHIRSIEHIALDFGAAISKTPKTSKKTAPRVRPRTVLIGANGAGKSTVLRAIALVLAGRDALPELLGEPALWVRSGQKEGRICAAIVAQNGNEHEVALTLRPTWSLRQTLAKNEKSLHELDAALAQAPSNFFTLGYGATRRPANAQAMVAAGEGAFVQPRARALATLFSTDATLVPFTPWVMGAAGLKNARTNARFDAFKSALNNMLPGIVFDKFDPAKREVLFNTPDGLVPFAQLSLGHQTMANWCADVLYRIETAFANHKAPLAAKGVLLVDGLDLHVHPAWQRVLLDCLAATLPNLQLVATTHAPMVVQQLREGELFVVERAGAKPGAVARTAVGDPSQRTLGQLMEPMFGIATAESKRVEELRNKARGVNATKPLGVQAAKARGGQATTARSAQAAVSRSGLSRAERDELALLAPLGTLPIALQRQLKATAELTDALARAGNIAPQQLDLAQLQRQMGKQISRAALRVGAKP